jgi:hypothetical protein
MKYTDRNSGIPSRSSTARPKIHRYSILPIRWKGSACRNVAVKKVRNGEAPSAKA